MMRRFFSTTLGQILAIIASSSAITFVLFLALLGALNPNSPPPPPWPWPAAYRIAGLVDSLRTAPESGRAIVLAAAQRADLSVKLIQPPAACETITPDTHELESVLRTEFAAAASNAIVRSCDAGDPGSQIQILLSFENQTLDIRTRKDGPGHFFRFTFPFVGALLFLCGAVAAMSAWAVWRVIRPLRRLSATADAFGRNIAIAPISEEGPLEIRSAAKAFNLMQERITRSIQNRTRMLAAISHDLRTPITRMRLQLDTQDANIDRGKLRRDVDLMQSMISSALAYLSGSFDEETKEWVDLGALITTLCDEYEEAGAAISCEGPGQIRFFCRPNAISRALTNLIENGIHFGSSVRINASTDPGVITIDVVDDGPGIPKERIQDVIEPFVRLDPSRSSRPGSVGLGLSIVNEIVAAHGGRLELMGRQPTGLVARVIFPVLTEERASPIQQDAGGCLSAQAYPEQKKG